MKWVFEYLRKLRETWIEKQVRRTVSINGKYRFYWQPPLFILFKSIAAAVLIIWLFSLSVYAGNGIEAGFRFFKLEKIFNLRFPGTEFFHKVSFLLFLVMVGFPSLLFFRDQLSALLSSVVINRNAGKLYYIENRIINIKTVTLSFDQIETVSLKQNFITGRLLKIGTIEIATKSGDRYLISSLGNADNLALQLSS